MNKDNYNFSLNRMLVIGLLFLGCLIHAAEVKAQATQTVLYRVNAGGAQIDDATLNWETDLSASNYRGDAKRGKPSPYLTLTDIAAEDWSYAITSFVDSGGVNDTPYPSELFASERLSISRKSVSQTWDFPVSMAGTYRVNLLFAEIWTEAKEPGKRVFGVSIEGNVVIDSLDQVKEKGWRVAFVKSFDVEVTDGNIDINLLKRIQNPAIKAIEILGPAGATTNLPPYFVSVPKVRGEGGETLNATFKTQEKDGDAVALTLTVTDLNGNVIDPGASTYTFTDKGDGTGTLVWPTQPTDIFFYNATITATDKDGAESKNFTIIVSEKLTDILYRVNAGGPELEDAVDPTRVPFAADQLATPSPYVSGGDTYKTNNTITLSSSVPAYVPAKLFQTERFWPTDSLQGKYSFPVPSGKMVSARIFLSEIFLKSEGPTSNDNIGPRVFDIIINGDTVGRSIDVYGEVGENVGIMRAYSVVSNGTIDISLNSRAEYPSLKGIEIVGVEPLIVSTSTLNPSCFGGNGSVSFDISGGIGPYEVKGPDGINPAQLLAGTYTFTITDGSGQQKTENITITQPTEAFSVAVETVNATAANLNDGKATAVITGGAEPFVYNWGDGVNPNSLAAGDYTLVVTDATACTATEEFVIGDPETLVADVKTTNPTCNGGTGTAVITPAGGTAPYTITWAGGVDGNALPAGEYAVKISDSNGKSIEKNVVITQPEVPLNIEVTSTDASKNGAADGSASLEVTGGTAPYNIFWGDTNPNALAAGTYTVMVKDAIGCEKTVEIVIGQPAELTAEITTTKATCTAAGTATVKINGGTFPYQESWSNNVNPDSLPAGTYQLLIKDAVGVSITKEVVIELECDEPVGTDPEAESALMNIYPVPGDGLLNVSIPVALADKEGVLRIFTLYGQTVYQQKIDTWHVSEVNVGHLSTGTYILEVSTKNKVLRRRFFIK